MNIRFATAACMAWGSIVILTRGAARQWGVLHMPLDVAKDLRTELDEACTHATPTIVDANTVVPESQPRQRAVQRTAAIFATVNGGGAAALWDRFVDAYELVEKLESELARVCTRNGELAAHVERTELELEERRTASPFETNTSQQDKPTM